MNAIAELLGAEDIVLDADAISREQILHQVAALLAARHGLSELHVFDSLSLREELGSTGLGQGVAIPHARLADCVSEAAVLLRTRSAIDFGSPDGKPVNLFLGLIVPRHATDRHLQLLGTAANMFGDQHFRRKLRTCVDATAARDLVAAWPDLPE
jgi:PTS system nitrogen regulatory IIA component